MYHLKRISSGFKALDDMLGGGIEQDAITEIYGEAGSGKTNLAIIVSKAVAVGGKKIVYIDTEGISAERVEQISGDQLEKVTSSMMITQPYSMKEQERAVMQAVKMAGSEKVGLIVVDSITGFYRMELGTDEESGSMHSLTKQMITLLTLARRYEIPVLITNQVYTDRERREYRPIGGHVVDHYAKAIIRLDRLGKGKRRAVLIKHRSREEGLYVKFRICSGGFEAISDADTKPLGTEKTK